MATEFDNSLHWGFFLTGPTLTSDTGKYVRMSNLVLSALRAAGVFSNMVDGIEAPETDKLWLDKNFDPAVLKEWDATGASWVPMTYGRLFGRAAVDKLVVTGGTGNAVVVSQPAGFQADRLYLITPTSDNDAATTITVSGVGTFGVKYGNGAEINDSEFAAGRQAVLFFTGSRFEVVFPVGDLNAAVVAAEAARDKAQEWAENPEDDPVEEDQFSSKHHAAKAAGSAALAANWAESPEELPGGGRSAKYWAEVAASGMPLGAIIYSAFPLEDQGFLLADGAPCTPVWSDLRAALIAAGSPFGNNGTDPLLPDEVTASRFRRAANEDLPVGTVQDDQIQNITGTWGNVILRNSSDVSGVFGTTADGPANATGASGASGTGRGLSFDASRVVRAGDETRPKSIAYLPYIKAFGAITIEGMADLSALFAALATEIEAVTGTDNTKLMTALRVRQACAAYNRWRTISFDELNAESSWVVTDLGDFKFLRLEGFLVSSVSANSLFRVSSDNGLTWKQGATDYWAIYDGTATASASNGATQNNYGYVCIASVGAGFPQTFQHFFSRWNVAGEKHVLSSAGNLNGSGNNTHYSWLTRMMAGAAVAANALQVIVSSGNFSGQLHLEGLS